MIIRGIYVYFVKNLNGKISLGFGEKYVDLHNKFAQSMSHFFGPSKLLASIHFPPNLIGFESHADLFPWFH